MCTPFLDIVRSTVLKRQMLKAGASVLVGVSGGPDSLALLAALVALRNEFKLRLRAAYVHHGLRPQAAGREAELVRRLGKGWGVPVHRLRGTVRRQKGVSLEAEARRVRYGLLIQLARSRGCRVVAIGHTRDDQAETVLMWLIRGAGMRGLSGIPPVRAVSDTLGVRHRIQIVRPLIDCSRVQVQTFLKAQGVRPLHDRTNRSGRFLRNRIRHQLLPLLEREFSARIRERLGSVADLIRQDAACLDGLIRRSFREVARVQRGRVCVDRVKARQLSSALRRGVLRLAVERLQGSVHGLSADHWFGLETQLKNGAASARDLPHRLRAKVEGDLLLLFRKPE